MPSKYVIEINNHEMAVLFDALGFSAGVHQKRAEEAKANECLDVADSLMNKFRPIVDVGRGGVMVLKTV